MNKTILTIAAHPDDEILGCGGTMARLAEEGNDVHIFILAEGLTSRDNSRNRDSKLNELSELSRTAKVAGEIVGAKTVELYDFPDNRMDSIDRLDIIKVIERKIEEVQPSVIFTHFGNDLNIDHRVTCDAVITATRPIPGQAIKEIFFFEVPSSTEWQFGNTGTVFFPNYFFSLSEAQLAKKIGALNSYQSEMRPFPHARSVEAVHSLAKWRGATIGKEAAEAFMVGRIIR